MSAGTLKTRISGVVILACLAPLLSAGYALDAAAVFHDRRMGSEDLEVVIAIDQKSAFLAYVMRQQIPSMHSLSACRSETLCRISQSDTMTFHFAMAPRSIVGPSLGKKSSLPIQQPV